MNQALQKELLTETYEEVQELIAKIVRGMMAQYGGFEFDELSAEANLHYIRAFNDYDATQSKFTTHLITYIKNGLFWYIRDEYRQAHISIDDENTNIDSLQTIPFSLIDLFDEMEQDTYTIIHLFFNAPKEIIELALSNGKHQKHMRTSLKNYLHNMGWTIRRITKTFEDLQNALQS